MTWYLVLWVGFNCPGGWLGDKFLPETARAFICQRPAMHAIETDPKEMMKRVREAGPGVRVFLYKGLRRSEMKVTWGQTVEVK
jgi:hypothetical protein